MSSMYWGIVASSSPGPVDSDLAQPTGVVIGIRHDRGAWRVGARCAWRRQSLDFDELVLLVLLLVLDEEVDSVFLDSDVEELLSDDDDDEPFSPASLVSRARFFVP